MSTEIASSETARSAPATTILSAHDTKILVENLFRVNPAIFWCDLIISSIIAYGAAIIYLQAAHHLLLQIVAFTIAGLAFFRIATFMHEIVHLRRDQMRGFKLVWNVIVGIPLLTPSLLYTSHADHHSNRHYGTPHDGEYLPFGATPPAAIIRFLATIPLIPLLAVLRALVLVPISFVVPKFRYWLLERASAAVIAPTYKRRRVPPIGDPMWLITDLACFIYTASVAWLIFQGSIAPRTIGMLYILIVFAIGLNWLRTLAAHRYRNDGSQVSHASQVLDSINIIGHPLATELLYPIGLRYHALHHLLPSLPYHALGKAHRRLMAQLPADSPYRQTSCAGTLAALRQLWRDAKTCGPNGITVRQSWRQT